MSEYKCWQRTVTQKAPFVGSRFGDEYECMNRSGLNAEHERASKSWWRVHNSNIIYSLLLIEVQSSIRTSELVEVGIERVIVWRVY